MMDPPQKGSARKGPNYHRIPEVRARRRRILTRALVVMIIAWAGISYWLMVRSSANLPGMSGNPLRPAPVVVDPMQAVKP